jgi:histidinol-phosphatase (PHP family)
MFANYHTHTWRCNHATDTEEEYVVCALERGLKVLGFSDHSPYFFPKEHDSYFRMKPEQLSDYVDTVLALRDKYRGQLEIPLGLELEYYPKYLPELLPVLKDAGIEYLLLGQHFVDNEIGAHYSGRATGDESILKRYCTQSCDAMQTGLFTYFAHPDLFFFKGSDAVYRKHMRLICREAKNCNLPLEVNLLGFFKNRNYPDRRFWELAAEEGCDVILGCDTHAAKHLLETETEAKAMKLIDEFGLYLLETVDLKPIR